ncbi:hypothetical protein D1007_15937 [Hordeum vulgare]|nr:hypothetical protein D1007_15937 [Hordeum vulgare]
MREKLYILEFTIQGFEKIGVDDPNDDEGPNDITLDDDEEYLYDIDKELLKEGDEGFDELDLANKTSTSNSVGSSRLTEAMPFHSAPLLAAFSPCTYGKSLEGGSCDQGS